METNEVKIPIANTTDLIKQVTETTPFIKLQKLTTENTNTPTHTPSGFQDQFYFQVGGILWVYMSGTWVNMSSGGVISAQMYADSQSITTNGNIAFNNTDHANGITADTTNYKMIVQTAGYYYIEATIGWDNPGTNILHRAYIKLNGSPIIMDVVSGGTTGLITYNHISTIKNLAVGDEIMILGTIDSGGAKSTLDTLQSTKLLMYKI